MWHDLWTYKVEVVPVALAFILVEFLGWLHRRAKNYYVPVYFTIFPVGSLNKDIAVYFGEDYPIYEGSALSPVDAQALRNRIRRVTVLSLCIAAIVVPLASGFLCVFFLNPNMLTVTLLLIVSYKAFKIWDALKSLQDTAIARFKTNVFVVTIYIMFLGMFTEMFRTAYLWGYEYSVEGDWMGLFSALSNMLFAKVLVMGLLLSVVGHIIMSMLLDPELRDEIFKEVDKSSE